MFLISACGGGGGNLFIEAQTDFVPGVEFVAVRTERFVRDSGTPADTTERVVFTGNDAESEYADGLRVAAFESVPRGAMRVVVSLLDGAGDLVARRAIAGTVDGTTGFRVLVTRDCRDVVCPGEGDELNEIECLGARCVDPRCTPETPDFCPAPECDADSDCTSTVACVEATCASGVCLNTPRSDRCDSGQYCDPDMDCHALPVSPQLSDSGMDPGGPDAGGPDAGGSPCEVGNGFTTFTEALVNADCDVIILPDGVHQASEAALSYSAHITIRGQGPSTIIRQDAYPGDPRPPQRVIFASGGITLEDLVVEGYSATEQTGTCLVAGPNTTLTRVTFRNCNHSGVAGAIYYVGSPEYPLQITDSIIENNSSATYGGGLYVDGSAIIEGDTA